MLDCKEFIDRHRLRPEDFSRRPKLTFQKLFLFLAQIRVQSMWREVFAFLDGVRASDHDSGDIDETTFFKARNKIGPSAFIEMNDHISELFYQQGDVRTWQGFQLLAVDGSTLRLPNEPQIVELFPGQKDETGKAGVPLGHVSLLHDPLNHITRSASLQSTQEGERTLLLDHGYALGTGQLLLADRGYAGVWVMKWLLGKGTEFCFRLAVGSWKCAQEFVASGKQEQIVELRVSTQESRDRCEELGLDLEPIRVRLVRVELQSGEIEVLATSLLDSQKFPCEVFAPLYGMRWGGEEHYKLQKCRAQMENFSGKSALSVLQDFHARIFALNLGAMTAQPAQEMIEAKYAGRKHRYQINWADLLCALRQRFFALFFTEAPNSLIQEIHTVLLGNPCPIRPGRSYPRNHRPFQKVHDMNYKPCL